MGNLLSASRTLGSYTRGPASGVDYFSALGGRVGNSNLNSGQTSLKSDAETPGAGLQLVKSDSGIYERGPDASVQSAANPSSAGGLNQIGAGLGFLGQATGEPGLSTIGAGLQAGSAAQQGNYAPAVGFGVGLMTGDAGKAGAAGAVTSAFQGDYAPAASQLASRAFGNSTIGQLAGMGVAGLQGNMPTKGMANSAISLAFPAYGMANAVTGGWLGDSVFGVQPSANPYGPEADIGTAGWLGTHGFANKGFAEGYAIPDLQNFALGQPSFGQLDTNPASPGFMGPPTSVPALDFGGSSGDGGGGYDGGQMGENSVSGGFDSNGAGSDTSFAADGGLTTSNGFNNPGITPRYADGGQVPLLSLGYANGGILQQGGAPSQGSVTQQVNQIMRNPRMRNALMQTVQQVMASGEVTPDEVTTMARVAEAAMYNPELYPQLRAFVAEQGMTPLPPSYDPSVVMRIMAFARMMQEMQPATQPGQVPDVQQAQMQPPMNGMARGGYLQGPGTGRSDSINTVNASTGNPVSVANGEYVIPEHVVRAKGREFFDNLLRRYADMPKEGV